MITNIIIVPWDKAGPKRARADEIYEEVRTSVTFEVAPGKYDQDNVQQTIECLVFCNFCSISDR